VGQLASLLFAASDFGLVVQITSVFWRYRLESTRLSVRPGGHPQFSLVFRAQSSRPQLACILMTLHRLRLAHLHVIDPIAVRRGHVPCRTRPLQARLIAFSAVAESTQYLNSSEAP
jgi:hypothetical protein